MANEIQNASAVSAAMAEIYRLRPAKAQFTRFQATLKHFKPGGEKMRGESMHKKMFLEPYTGVRRVAVSESEFPLGRQIKHVDVEIDYDDFTEYQATITYTGLARRKTESRRDAVYRVAQELVGEAQDDFAGQVNVSLHQNDDCVMGLINGTPLDADGTSRTTGTTGFLPIDGGSISVFHPGQVIDIRSQSNNADVQVTVIVNDVYPTKVGPGTATTAGPGIVVTIAAENTGLSGDADLDNLVDNDEICLRGETEFNIQGFPTWFGTGAVFSITRTAIGSHWAVPFIYDKNNGSGLPVTLDLEDHFGEIAEQLALAVNFGRSKRVSSGITITEAMVAISTPSLLAEASRQVGDDVRFTMAIEEAERKKLIGRSGFSGAIWHSPTLGPVMLQSDAVATPNAIRFLEPDSWTILTAHDGSRKQIEWLDKDGSRWHYIYGTNGRLVNQLQAGALMRLAVFCDQPKANVELKGVKSSRDT